MMTNRTLSILPRKSLVMAGILALSLAACSTAPQPPVGDYRLKNQVVVLKQPYTMSLTLPQSDKDLAPIDQARVSEFVDRFVKRGEGAVMVSVDGDPEDPAARARIDKVKGILLDAGLFDAEVDMRVNAAETSSEAVLLSFDGYVAQVPECGKFDDGTAFQPSNLPSDNYGCSIQRNIGLMVSNPRDLVQARPKQGRDANRAYDVMGKYKIGEDTRSKTPVSGAVAKQTQGQAGN